MDHCEQGVFCTDVDQRERKCNYFLCNRFEPQIGNDELLSVLANKMQRTIGVSDPNSEERISSKIQGDKTIVPTSRVTSAEVLAQREEAKEMNLGGVLASQLHAEKEMAVVCPDISILAGNQSVEDVPLEGVMTREVVEQMPPYTTIASKFCVENELTSELVRGHVTANVTLAENSLDSDLFAEGKVTGGILTCDLAANSFAEVPTDSLIIEVGSNSVPSSETLPTNGALVEHRLVKPPAVTTVSEDMFVDIEVAKMDPLEGVRTNHVITESKLPAVPLDTGATVEMSAKGEGVIEVSGEGIPASAVFVVGLLPMVHADDKATIAVSMEGEVANQVPSESTKINGLFAENGLSKIFQGLNLGVEMSAECEKSSEVTEVSVPPNVMVSGPKVVAGSMGMSTDEGAIDKELGDVAITNGVTAECPFTTAATKVSEACESAAKIDVVINNGMTAEKPSETTEAKLMSAGCELTTEMSGEVVKTCEHPSIGVTTKIFVDDVLANNIHREPMTTNETTEVPTDITSTLEMSAEDEEVEDMSGESVASLHLCVTVPMEIAAGEVTSDGSAEDLTSKEMPTKMSVEDEALAQGLKNDMMSSVPPDNTTAVVSSDHEMFPNLPGEVVTTSEVTEVPPDVPVAMEISADCVSPNKVSEDVETANGVVSIYADKTVNNVLGECFAISKMEEVTPETTAAKEVSSDSEIFAGMSAGGVSNGEASDTASTLRISTKVLGNEVSDVGATSGGVSNVSPNTTVKRPEEHVIICSVFRESATSNIMTAEPLDSTTTMNISSDAELSGEVVMTSGVAEVPLRTIGTLEKTGKGGLAKEEFGEGLTTNVQVSVHPLLAVAKEMTERIPVTTEIVEILSCANTRDDVTTDGMIQVPLDSAATIGGEIANVSEEGGTINRVADVPPDPATVATPAECLVPDFISGKVVTANGIADRSPDTTAIVETSEIIESCGKTMLIGEIPEVTADVSTPLGRSSEIVMTELPDECLNTEAARDTCESTTTMEVASDGATVAEPFGECVITSTETDVTPRAPVTTVISARGVMADQISDDVEGTDALAFIPSDTFAGNLSAECVIPNEASGEVVTTDGIIEVPPGTAARLPMSAESDGSNKPAGEDTITNEVVELLPDTTASVTANDDHGNNVMTSVVAGVPPEATVTMETFSEVERETDVSGEDVTTSRMTKVPPDMIVTMEISGEGGIAAVVSGNEVVTNAKAEVPQAPTESVLLPGGGEGNEIDIVVSGEDVTSNVVSEMIPDTGMSSVMSAERVIPAEMVSMNPDIPRSDVVADIVSEEREMTEEVAEIPGDTTKCGEVLANGEILSQDSGEDVRTNGMAKLLLNTMGAMEMSVECEMSGESLTSEMKEVTPAITASVEFSSYLSGESVTAIEITEAVPSTTEMMETAVDDKITNCIPAEDVRASGMAEVHLHTTSTIGMFAESKMVSDVSGERATTNEMIEVPTAIVATVEVSSDHMVSSSDLSGEGMTICRMIEASPDTTGSVEMVTENEKATEASGKVDMITKDRAEGLPGTTTMEISSDGATIAEPFGECLITGIETDAPITTVISARGVIADQMSDDVEGTDALAFIPSDTFAGDLSAGCVMPNEVSGEVVTTDGIIEVPPGTTAILQMSAESDASNKPAGEDTITNELVELRPDTSVSLSNSEEGIIANDGYQCGAADEKTEVPAGRVMTEMSDDGEMFTALPGQVMKTNWMSEAPSKQTMSAEGAVANGRSAESVTNEIVEVPPDFLPTTMEMSTQGQITSELSAEGVPNCEVVSVYPGVMTAQVSFSEGVKANELAGEDIQTNGLAEMEMTAEADVDTEILGESVATTELAENTRAAKDTSEESEMVIEHPEVVRTTEMAETSSDLRVSWDLAAGSIVNNEISGKNIAILALASVCLSMLGTIQLPTEGDIVNKVSGEGTSLGVTDILPDAKVGTFADTSASGESVINNDFKEFLNKAVAMETSTEGAEPDKVSEDMVTSKVTEAPADLAAAMEMTVDSVVTNDVSENVMPSEIAPGLLCAILTKGISAEDVEVQDVSEEDITTAGMTNMPPDAILSVENSAEDEGNAVITESFANSGVTELPRTSVSTLGNSAESQIPIEPSGELVLTSGVSKELPTIAASLEMAAGGVTIEGERADEMSVENETADQVPRNTGAILEISSESDGTTSIGEAEHLLHVTAVMEVSGPGVIDNEVSEKHAVSFGLPSAVALEDEISSEDVKASNQSGEGATTNPVVEMPQGATSTREDEETTEISEEGVVTNRLTEVPTPAATATIQMSTMGHLADEMSDKEVATRNVASEQPGVLVTKGISVTGVGANETLEDDVKTSDVTDVPPDTAMPLEISVDGEQASEMSKRDTAINAIMEISPEITGTKEIIPDVEIANDVLGEGAKHNGMFGENMSAKVFLDPAIAMETFAQNMIVKPVPIECQSSVSEVSSQMDSDILLTNNTEVEVMAKIKGAKLVSEGLAAVMLNQMPSGERSNNRSQKRKASESLADVCAYRPSNALCCAGCWCTTMKVIECELQSVSVTSTDYTSLHLQSKEQLVNRVGNEHSLPVSDRSLGTFGAVKYQRVDKKRSLCYRNTMKENNSMLKMEELNSAKLYNFAYCNPLFSKLQLIDRSALRFDCCHREDHKYDTCDMVIGASQLEETKPKNIHVPPVNALVSSKLSGELLPIEKLSSKAGYMVSAKCVRMEPASLHKLEMLQAMDMCSTFQTSKWMDLNFCLNTELKSCWNSPCMPNFSQDQYENTMKLQPLTLSSGNYWVPRSNHTQFVTPIFPVSSNIKLAPIFSSLTISNEAMEQCISKRTDWSILPYCSSEDSWTILQWLNGLGKNSWPLSTLCKSQLCTCTRLKFGLPTILALSSPGCYRVWTRRHCLGSRIPTVQRMFLTQFEEHLKGLNTPIPLDKRFPSMLCILGRIVSWWNQHGPSFTSSTGSTNNCRRMSMGSSPSYFLSDLITKNGTDFSGAKPLLLLQTSQRTDVRPLNLRELCPAVSDLPISPAECTVTDLSIFPTALPTSPSVSCVENQLCSEQKEVCAAPDETKRKPKGSARKVSQIRIRKTIPKQDTNLTPMGLPKPKRLKKKEFSLEEIYTNKNYKSPSANSKYLETIFEEPVLKKGSFVCTSLQKRKRLLEFQDYTLPRKRRAHSGVKIPGRRRCRKTTPREGEIDSLLIQKLTELEAFLSGED